MNNMEEMQYRATRIHMLWYRIRYWAKCPICLYAADKDDSLSRTVFLEESVNCPECQGTRLDAIPWAELFHGEHYEARRGRR